MAEGRTNLRIGWTTVAVLVALAPVWATAQPKSDPKRSQLPAAVVKAIDANCPGAEIDKLDVEDEAGIKLYDIEFKAGRGEIEVAEDGTVLDVATIVQLKDVPEAAAAVIRNVAGTGGVRQVEKSEVRSKIEKKDGKGRLVPVAPPEYMYEAELAEGGEIEVAADGKVIEGPKAEGKESPDKK
jgi:hypothetical protein